MLGIPICALALLGLVVLHMRRKEREQERDNAAHERFWRQLGG